MVEIRPIAFFRSPFKSKFGIPRQSGVVPSVEGEIVFEPEYRSHDAIRGIDEFSHLWLLWQFSQSEPRLLVRPPRLGGNRVIGVFASRSPYRPNGIGLSCVRLVEVISEGRDAPRLRVAGADLMDGTPIFDIKPYVRYADSQPDAICGFVDDVEWSPLNVVFPEELQSRLSPNDVRVITETLRQDPRPHYHHDANRIYGMQYYDFDVRFRVADHTAVITSLSPVNIKQNQ